MNGNIQLKCSNYVAFSHFHGEAVNNIGLLFIVVLFFYRKNDKSKKYIVFGVFYILCVALNFCSESMVNMIVFFLNRVSTQNICLESYEMLYFNVLTPIKEAILTYIIFDVVFEKKEKKIFSVDVIDKQSLLLTS